MVSQCYNSSHDDVEYKLWEHVATTGGPFITPFMENSTELVENVTESIDPFDEYSKRLVKNLWLVFPPIVVLVGTCGNILCFLVTRRRSLRRSSVGMCLSVLALADLMVLYTGVTRNWSKEMFGWDVRNVHESLCKLHRLLLYFSLDYSAWVLVTVTIERFVSVCYPFKAVRICTLKTTRKILIFVAVFICMENVGVLIVKGRETVFIKNSNSTRLLECGYTSEAGKFYWRTFRPWCVIILYAVIPFAIMIVCGLRIIKRLYSAKRYMKEMEKSYQNRSHPSLLQPNGHADNHVTNFDERQAHKMNLASVKMHSVTVMTVVIACVFLLMVTPSHLEFFLEVYWDKTDASDFATFRLVEASSRTLLYTYHAIPFFVYMASGKQFRREFISMIKRQKSEYGYTLNASRMSPSRSSPAVIRRTHSISTVAGNSPAIARHIKIQTSNL